MKYYIYILKSLKTNRYYIGSCKDLAERLKKHNSGVVKSTKFYRPWVRVYFEAFSSLGEARSREKQIKNYKGGNAFKKLIKKI